MYVYVYGCVSQYSMITVVLCGEIRTYLLRLKYLSSAVSFLLCINSGGRSFALCIYSLSGMYVRMYVGVSLKVYM